MLWQHRVRLPIPLHHFVEAISPGFPFKHFKASGFHRAVLLKGFSDQGSTAKTAGANWSGVRYSGYSAVQAHCWHAILATTLLEASLIYCKVPHDTSRLDGRRRTAVEFDGAL
jgi:hypothetical protein